MKATDEADLIERIAEALSIQQRPTRAWSECSPITQSYWRASARAVLPILTDFAEALASASGSAALRYVIHPQSVADFIAWRAERRERNDW